MYISKIENSPPVISSPSFIHPSSYTCDISCLFLYPFVSLEIAIANSFQMLTVCQAVCSALYMFSHFPQDLYSCSVPVLEMSSLRHEPVRPVLVSARERSV